MDRPKVCFTEYAMTKGVNVGGGSICSETQELAEEVARFHLGISGSCGAHPKEEAVVEGNWLTLAVWGIPDSAETVTITQGDGALVDIDPKNGVALHIWDGHVEVASITFDGISQAQEGFLSEVLPVEGIADDCDPNDGEG